MNNQKGIGGLALVVIIAVVAVAGGAFLFISGNNSPAENVVENTAENPQNTDNNLNNEESMDTDSVTVDITGRNFEFSQDTITVKRGQEVTINFTSEEGFHDFVVDEFDAATEQVQAGESTSVTFVASEAGEFEYYCSVGTHRQMGMVGTLVVEE